MTPIKVISGEKKRAVGKINILAILCSKVKTQKMLGKNLPTIS